MRVDGALRVAEDFERQAQRAGAKARQLEERGAQEVATGISKKAPRDTGAYAASWVERDGVADSDHPAANRLEKGFRRADSLGREYNQPAQPHIGPAVDHFESQRLERMAESIVLDALI